jgi:hypothetical protein
MTKKSRDGIVPNASSNASMICQVQPKMDIHGIEILVFMTVQELAAHHIFSKNLAVNVNVD